MRKRIYEMICVSNEDNRMSAIYDAIMMAVIIISILPLCFKSQTVLWMIVDRVTVTIFILDYVLRLITADFKYPNYKASAFVIYPFSPLAIIDLISILPSLTFLNSGFRLLKLFRLIRSFRVFKIFRYSKNLINIINVIKNEKDSLLAVGYLALGYIFVSALIMFQVDSEVFDSFFDALYWATTALTTVGYGDIYPVSLFGRLVSMISSLIGIAVVALPAGIITAGFLDVIKKK